MRVIFVKRGQYSTYNVLVSRCQALPDVDVRWDRRLEDRRSRNVPIGDDRRRDDRRGPPKTDCTPNGYSVVDEPDKSH
jgi:hypothetical protein